MTVWGIQIDQVPIEIRLQYAAAETIRTGVTPMPPDDWQLEPTEKEARNPVLAARNRLGAWELDVHREAGNFLEWCYEVGILRGRAMRWYLDDASTEDLGRWYCWLHAGETAQGEDA